MTKRIVALAVAAALLLGVRVAIAEKPCCCARARVTADGCGCCKNCDCGKECKCSMTGCCCKDCSCGKEGGCTAVCRPLAVIGCGEGPINICCKAACACCKDCCCGKDCGCAKKGKCCASCGCAKAAATTTRPVGFRAVITRVIQLSSPMPCPATASPQCCVPPCPLPAPAAAPVESDVTWYAPAPQATGVYWTPSPHSAPMLSPPPVVYPHPTLTPPMPSPPPPPAVVCIPVPAYKSYPACQWTLRMSKRAGETVQRQAADDGSEEETVVQEDKVPCLVLDCCGEMQAHCDGLTLKMPSGQPIKIAARRDHIRLSGAGFEACCESLSRAAQPGCLVLQGKARVEYHNDAQTTSLTAETVTLKLVEGVVQAEGNVVLAHKKGHVKAEAQADAITISLTDGRIQVSGASQISCPTGPDR